MEPSACLDVAAESLKLLLLLSIPFLAAALLSGILTGLLAVATRLSEPAIGMAARSLCVLGGILLIAPWLAERVKAFACATWQLIAHAGG